MKWRNGSGRPAAPTVAGGRLFLSFHPLCRSRRRHRHRRRRPLSFPRAHVRTNGCPCICKSGAVFGSPSASHLSMSRRERRIHSNTPGQPGVRVRASTSERRGQPSVSRDFHPRRRNATPGLVLPPPSPLPLPPLPPPPVTTLTVAAGCHPPLLPLGDPPPSTDIHLRPTRSPMLAPRTHALSRPL